MPKTLTFSEQWDFYPSYMGNKHYSVRYDTAVKQLSKQIRQSYPHILVIRVPFEQQREDGFPTREEMQRLNNIEDHFNIGALDVRHIGVLTGDGCSCFVFCCAASVRNFESAAQHLMKLSDGCKYGYQVFENDCFGYFDNVLSPSAMEQNWIVNRNVCHNLEQQGEAFETPRPIDFYFYFGDEQDLRSIADLLCGQGFLIAGREPQEDGTYMLHLTLADIPTLQRMTEVTEYIFQAIEDKNGCFDGWGCSVHSKKGNA